MLKYLYRIKLYNYSIVFLSAIVIQACSSSDSGDASVGSEFTPTQPLTITINSPANYQVEAISVGSEIFVDRDFVFTNIPEKYLGKHLIQTANDDKTNIESEFLSFNSNQKVEVYIAYDIRISSLPEWLSSWTATGESVDGNDTTRMLYKKAFEAGEIILGGNSGTSGSSMYSVIILNEGSPHNNGNLVASDDSFQTLINQPVNIAVLANDQGLENTTIDLSIIDRASDGTTTIQSDNTITYVPNNDFAGEDFFVYGMTDSNNNTASASVFITVTCDNGCMAGRSINFLVSNQSFTPPERGVSRGWGAHDRF